MSDDFDYSPVIPKGKKVVFMFDGDALRDRFAGELRSAPSLDENGYICTKDEAMKAFARAIGDAQ